MQDKMTNLKFIVTEINKFMKTDYNLISLDSMPIANLVQILVDILTELGALTKFDVKESDPDFTKNRLLEALNRIQYHRVEQNYASLARKLVIGDKNEIYNIFQFIFKDIEQIRNTIYLSKYLLPINLPPEALATPSIANLQEEYQLIMNEFKEAHKQYQTSIKDNSQLRELRNDIEIIESERGNVKKRIDRTQSRLDKLSNQELLLEAAHALRIEKDRQKELDSQLETQKQDIQRSATINTRLQHEMKNVRLTVQDLSPEYIMNSIMEKTQVLQFMVEQKLPKEIAAKQMELRIYEDVIAERNINSDYLHRVQHQIESLNRELRALTENRVHERDNDNLLPFRQQAATVIRMKDTAAEQLDELTKAIREIDTTINRKQSTLQQVVGETYLRGDELKQYVNMLKAKSSVYKKQRAELSELEIEYADLESTLEKLKSQYPSLYIPNTQSDSSGGENNLLDDVKPLNESATMMDISRLVTHLTTAVAAARERVTALLQQLQPLKEKMIMLKDECDEKKKAYNALQTTLNAEMALTQSEVAETETAVKNLERNWAHIQTVYNRNKVLLQKAQEDADGVSSNKLSLKTTLTEQIKEQENIVSTLKEDIQTYKNDKNNMELQRSMWYDLNALLNVKIECHREALEADDGGTLSVNKGAETFTLR